MDTNHIYYPYGYSGHVFFFKEPKDDSTDSSSKPKRSINGLLLGALNISMFIYWTAIFAVSNRYVIIDENSPWLHILLFLTGVLLGMFLILYLYGRLSDYMTDNFSSFKGALNKIIGVVLIVAAVGQTVKLLLV